MSRDLTKLSANITMPIGGYMELSLADTPILEKNIWDEWVRQQTVNTFRNARSALIWLLRSHNCSRIWLPAYICESVYMAVKEAGINVEWYSVGEKLEPDVSFLHDVESGDAVLSVCYFGRPVNGDVADALSKMSDVLHIEDRAQALAAGAYVGDWAIYSPRKLVGVPDGGIAVHVAGSVPDRKQPAPVQPDETLQLVAHLVSRFEDPTMQFDQYLLYQKAENAMHVSNKLALRITGELLRRLPFEHFVKVRKKNWQRLYKDLSHLCLWDDAEPDWAPMGFPVKVNDITGFVQEMARKKIFCPRHWSELPSPEDRFIVEHALSRSLVTLPCDHRLDIKSIERVINAVIKYQDNV